MKLEDIRVGQVIKLIYTDIFRDLVTTHTGKVTSVYHCNLGPHSRGVELKGLEPALYLDSSVEIELITDVPDPMEDLALELYSVLWSSSDVSWPFRTPEFRARWTRLAKYVTERGFK